ncbi:hypothetical protein [Nocardioides caricicola]|uniref:Uncharacterized protein n=1 Tax=Nocardioides caricicola TaxID=634770 RepID=A0ABW0MZN2_9ACTN
MLAAEQGNGDERPLPDVDPAGVLFNALVGHGVPWAVVAVLVYILAFFSWLRVAAVVASGITFVVTAGTIGIERTPVVLKRLATALAAGAVLVVTGTASSQALTVMAGDVGALDYESLRDVFADLFALRHVTEVTIYVSTALLVVSALMLYDVSLGRRTSLPLLYLAAVTAVPAVLIAGLVGLFSFIAILLGGLFDGAESRMVTLGCVAVTVVCAGYAWSIWAAVQLVDPASTPRSVRGGPS